MSPHVSTTVRLAGTGFRNAGPKADIRAMAGGVSVPVVSFGPMPGVDTRDQLTIKLPDELIGYGETDLWLKVNGVLSNVVRINFGSM